jgi:hypothetical protein
VTAPDQVNLVITLNGVDVTAYCDLGQAQPEIVSALDEELDTLMLTLQDADVVNPLEWQEITVADGSTKIFGGFVNTVTKKKGQNAANNDYELGCSDYAILLDKVIVKAEYEGNTDAEIIADVFTAAELSAFDGVSYVAELVTMPKVRFNRMTAREILDWICEYSGGHWYMNYEKQLRYFMSEENSAPFDVTEDPTDTSRKTVEEPKLTKSCAGVVNLVEVVGGNYLSDDRTEMFSSDGFSNSIKLLNRMSAPSTGTSVVVRRNDGGATTNLVVNPSFEVNITDGWTQVQDGNGGAWSQQTLAGYSGTKVLKIKAGTAQVRLESTAVSLAPGESITASCLVKCATIGKAGVRICRIGPGGENNLVAADTNRKAGSIERVSATYTSNLTSTASFELQMFNDGNDNTLEAFFDAAQFEKKSWPTAYCDGSLGDGYAWTGTANNSTSIRADIPIWTTLTVKVGNIDTLTGLNEVLYFYTTARLEQLKFWPGKSSAAEIDGRYEIPMRTRVRNEASHAYYGKWVEGVVVAPEIVDRTVGKLRAKVELARNAYANPTISYEVLEPGLRAGETQRVTFNSMGVNDSYLIQRVTTRIGVGGFVRAEVELGAVDSSLVGLLLRLKRASVPVLDWNENEVLDELLDTAEEVTLFEYQTVVKPAHMNTIYKWDSNAKWDFARWG